MRTSIAQDISEQTGSLNDIRNWTHQFANATVDQRMAMTSSFAFGAQAAAANFLVDFTGVNSAANLILGTDVHVSGSDLMDAEHAAAINMATEELNLPGQIKNTYVNAINAAGNFLGTELYNAAPGWF